MVKETNIMMVNGCHFINLLDEHGNIFATVRVAELLRDEQNNVPRLIRVECIENKITVIAKGYKCLEEEL